jgi:hypothetical protein
MDPGAATAAVLQVPPGDLRNETVDFVAGAMAKTDPSAAINFVLKSGALSLGHEAVQAWLKLETKGQSPEEMRPAGEEALQQMTPGQRDSLFGGLADWMTLTLSGLRASDDIIPHADLEKVARCVFLSGDTGPGVMSFLQACTRFPDTVAGIRQMYPDGSGSPPPGWRIALRIFDGEDASDAIAGTESPFSLAGDPFQIPSEAAAHEARATPAELSSLARSGNLPEALQILDQIQDPALRLTSLESVLSVWMDTDPAAARAAFNASPFTALERERWQHHPAFLLHPQ